MIRKLTRIEEIVANIGEEVVDQFDDAYLGSMLNQVIVTPGDCAIAVDGNTITLLDNKGHDMLSDGNLPSWRDLLNTYGRFHTGQSQLRIMLTDDIEGAYVAGTLQWGPTDNTLIWTIDADTLPANTLAAVDAVIDPLRSSPINGLPSPVDGTRYLLVNDIGASAAWGNINASSNDIIAYNGTLHQWQVSFDASNITAINYVLNLHTQRQLRWSGNEWLMSIDSLYFPGYWRLAL
jgi:hypothetical protein